MAILKHTTRRKILIPEKVSPDGLALLKGEFDVDERKGLSPEELKSIIGDYEALIVRSETKVTEDLLNAAKKMKVVARAGVGVDNVSVECATLNGIIVVNSPSGNINAAAEHTIARTWPGLFPDSPWLNVRQCSWPWLEMWGPPRKASRRGSGNAASLSEWRPKGRRWQSWVWERVR